MRASGKHAEDDQEGELLTVDDVVRRWKNFGATRQLVWRLHRRKVLRASSLRKRGLLFHIDSVRAAEEGVR